MDLLISYLEKLSQSVPVEIFSLVGGLLEELIAPIPSPLVMALSGSVLDAQGKALWYLFIVALFGSIGKTLGCWFWYFLADVAEDVVLRKLGKFIGISHADMEHIGGHFKNSEKDFLLILVSRAIPLMPSTPVSVIAGAIKIEIKKYLAATFIGNYIKNVMFLYVGYIGLETYQHLLDGVDSASSIIQIVIGVALVVFIGWIYHKRGKGTPMEMLKAIVEGKKKPQE